MNTKKIFSILMIVMTTSIFQNLMANEPAFDKGSKTLGLSAGFGLGYGYYGKTVNLPAFVISYDHGIKGDVGPGTIGIGGIVGWKSSHYKYGNGDYRATWTSYIFAARATYHLTVLKDKNNKFDPYAGVTLGVRMYRYKDTYYDRYGGNPYNYGSMYGVYGAFIGAKYNFAEHFGAFAELGYDISFARLGLCVNF